MIFYSRTYFFCFFGCLANIAVSLKIYETKKITFPKKAEKKEEKELNKCWRAQKFQCLRIF